MVLYLYYIGVFYNTITSCFDLQIRRVEGGFGM